jgi:hypothetical protein
VVGDRKKDSVLRAGSIVLPLPSQVKSVHDIILKPALSRFFVCSCIEESTPLFSLLGTLRRSCCFPTSKGAYVTSLSQPARSCARAAHSEKVIALPPSSTWLKRPARAYCGKGAEQHASFALKGIFRPLRMQPRTLDVMSSFARAPSSSSI